MKLPIFSLFKFRSSRNFRRFINALFLGNLWYFVLLGCTAAANVTSDDPSPSMTSSFAEETTYPSTIRDNDPGSNVSQIIDNLLTDPTSMIYSSETTTVASITEIALDSIHPEYRSSPHTEASGTTTNDSLYADSSFSESHSENSARSNSYPNGDNPQTSTEPVDTTVSLPSSGLSVTSITVVQNIITNTISAKDSERLEEENRIFNLNESESRSDTSTGTSVPSILVSEQTSTSTFLPPVSSSSKLTTRGTSSEISTNKTNNSQETTQTEFESFTQTTEEWKAAHYAVNSTPSQAGNSIKQNDIKWTRTEVITVILIMLAFNLLNLVIVAYCVKNLEKKRRRWERTSSIRFGSRGGLDNGSQVECIRATVGRDLASDDDCKFGESKILPEIAKDAGWCAPFQEMTDVEAKTDDTGV